MKDFISLKFLDKFQFIFEKFGVDYKIMRRILQIKLIMDRRRVPTIMANDKKGDEDKNFFIKSLISYGVIGLVTMIFIILPLALFVKMSFCLGMIMFMIMTTMISDFSSVLLDIKDKNILMCKPINSKTINAAKIVHISIYMFIITMVIAGPSLIVGTIKHGAIFFLIFSLDLLLSSTFIIFLTSMLYSLVLNFFDGEKLKDVINYVQIILSIVLIVGYQFIGRIFYVFNTDSAFTVKWWTYFIPPAWFAAPFEIFIEKNSGSHYIYLSFLSLLVPVVALIIYVKIITPYFEKNLSKLNDSSTRKRAFADIKIKLHKKIASLFCFEKMENIFFRFTQNMISNERRLKLKIYPSMVFAAIMPLIMIFRTIGYRKTLSEAITEISEGKSYFTIYITVFMLSNLIMMIKTSEKYKGAWIYRVLPIETPAAIYKGAWKGFLMKYIIPIYMIPSLVFLMIYGFKIFIDIILVFLNLILLCLIVFNISSKSLPFCKDFNYIREDNIRTLISAIGFCGVSVVLHMIFRTITKYSLFAYCGGLVLIIIVVWKKTMKIKWKDML